MARTPKGWVVNVHQRVLLVCALAVVLAASIDGAVVRLKNEPTFTSMVLRHMELPPNIPDEFRGCVEALHDSCGAIAIESTCADCMMVNRKERGPLHHEMPSRTRHREGRGRAGSDDESGNDSESGEESQLEFGGECPAACCDKVDLVYTCAMSMLDSDVCSSETSRAMVTTRPFRRLGKAHDRCENASDDGTDTEVPESTEESLMDGTGDIASTVQPGLSESTPAFGGIEASEQSDAEETNSKDVKSSALAEATADSDQSTASGDASNSDGEKNDGSRNSDDEENDGSRNSDGEENDEKSNSDVEKNDGSRNSDDEENDGSRNSDGEENDEKSNSDVEENDGNPNSDDEENDENPNSDVEENDGNPNSNDEENDENPNSDGEGSGENSDSLAEAIGTGDVPLQNDVTDGGNSSNCFAADARVRLESGALTRMDELKVGDRVWIGGDQFSDVYFFGHADRNSVSRDFVSIQLESGATVELTKDHLVRDARGGRYVAAQHVRVGDSLYDAVHGISHVVHVQHNLEKRGLFNPHTMHGDIVVGNVLVSSFTTAVNPFLAHILLLPERLAYLVGTRAYGKMLEAQTPAVLVSLKNQLAVSTL
ncbi:hypothetical protein FVE85_1590 [Porphyridium purpureum]|uniref:Hint domain-containing protein n=1 Tax=Porphyridium purpureum TaxID=35688 RepID=A0A5J4YVY8_PORPP|nr:hypothetical protein FVE85_1590 [Porphyridium purpureum]|eukprot:POR3928..scf209_3